MKITYVTESTELWGGIYVVFQHLELLSDVGHHAFLTTLGAKPDWYPLEVPICSVQCLDTNNIPRADIIVATSWTTIRPVVESKKGIPVHLCQGYEGDFKELQPQKAAIDEVYSYDIPKLTVSPHLDGFLRKRFNAETHYIGQALDRDIFYAKQDWQKEISNKTFTILVVGPFQADFKNIGAALAGIRLVRERLELPVKLIRVSQFPLSDEERGIMEPDEYHFHVPHHEMGRIYREADLFVSMSKEAEGFGLPALEAMACGVPTVLSSISSYTSFDENGGYSLFVNHSDPESLADAIVEIYYNRSLREKLVSRGLNVATKFTGENVLNRLNKYFESILLMQLNSTSSQSRNI